MPIVVLALAIGSAGCSNNAGPTISHAAASAPAVQLPDGPGLRVLFLGNSLTAGHHLPALVQAMAMSGGVVLHYHALTPAGAALEDQWNIGPARQILAATRWDFVVLQQGPSTLPESQTNLREWTVKWSEEARRLGVSPALYMVWPYQGQSGGFELVSKSYRSAATAGNARILPAGEAWQESLRRDPALALYQGDRLHPTVAGSYLAALVITHGLTGLQPRAVPAQLTLDSGGVITLPEDQAQSLREAAEMVIALDR